MRWHTQNNERKNLSTKNSIPSEAVPQKWKRNKGISEQMKVKGFDHHKTLPYKKC